MFLKNLQLYHFRSYKERFFTFSDGLNCIIGKNGSGKTNLLDAIYFLALSKSFIHNQDLLSINFDEDFSVIEGVFSAEVEEMISFHISRGNKKTGTVNKKAYEKLSEHIGKYPVVLIAPNDTDLIRDGAETRRKLFDGMLSQDSPEYLKDYLLYNRTLDQRNGLLKQFAEQNYFDEELLEIYSARLMEVGRKLSYARENFITTFTPIFYSFYQKLSENAEPVSIQYITDFRSENFPELFYKNLQKDLAAQRTGLGVHKDDFEFFLEEKPLKKFGSQGQRKSFVIALKLAQFEWIYQQKGIKPILLLDDIFDKLDDPRISKLLEMVREDTFGQVFITDARYNRTIELFSGMQVNMIEIR